MTGGIAILTRNVITRRARKKAHVIDDHLNQGAVIVHFSSMLELTWQISWNSIHKTTSTSLIASNDPGGLCSKVGSPGRPRTPGQGHFVGPWQRTPKLSVTGSTLSVET